MDLQRVKSAMARLTTPRSTIQGTAFLVDARLMLTCAHCIASDPVGADLIPRLEFTEWPQQMRRSFDSGELTLLNVDRVRDLALIRLDRSIPDGVQPLPLASDAMLGDSWTTFAYPEPVDSDGLPMDGTIEDPRGRSYDKPRLTLRCRQAVDWVRGASGAPIVSGGLVVGVLNNQLGVRNAEGTTQTAYQTVYGTPCSEIRAVFAELPMVDTGPFGELDDGVAAAQREYLHQFLRFYLGTDALPVGFGGRGDQLLALERWLADDDHPFGLLAATAGRGKSALVIRWSETLRTERRARVVFVPISLRFETARLSDTVTVLLTRMRRVLGVAGPPPGDVSAAREELARLCREAGAEDAPLLVVLDGLDEALDWRYDYSRLGLPPELPHWLKVIATYRSDPTATAVQIASRLGWLQGTVQVFDELLPLSPAGVGEALASVTPSATELPAGITPELYRLSGGDPLLLGLYLEQLVERLASGSIEGLADDLKEWEPGWREYLAKWWEGQRKLWGGDDLEDRRAATLLCLLAAALGPLTREELVEVSKPLDEKEKVDEFTFRRVLTTVGRLVTAVRTITPKGKEQIALTLSHPRLAPFLRDLFFERYGLDFARYDKLLVDWCRQAKAALLGGQMLPHDVPDYVLRHLPEHFAVATATDELADLLGESWRAARSRIDGSDDAFLADIAQAWPEVERRWLEDEGHAQSVSDAALRLARCALLAASGMAVQDWPADLVVTMAPLGRWTEGAMLATLQRLQCPSHSVMRAFEAVRQELSPHALAGLADDTQTEPLLRLAAAAELARREGMTALAAILARAGWLSIERRPDAQALVAPWLSASELAQTVADLHHSLAVQGHVAKALHMAVQVAGGLDGEARRAQLEAIGTVMTAAAGMPIGRLSEAILERPDVRPREVAASGPERVLLTLRQWALGPQVIVSLLQSQWPPVTIGEELLALLAPIRMPDLSEKRTAQVADVLARTMGKKKALEHVHGISRPFLRAKGLARIARESRDLDVLDEAVQAVADHHDCVACAAAALELTRAAGGDAAGAMAGSLGGLVRASLEYPEVHEPWAWAALGTVMPQADVEALGERLCQAVRLANSYAALEMLSGLANTPPPIRNAALALAIKRADLPAARDLIRAFGVSLDEARLAELWRLGPHVRQGIAFPLACRGTVAQAQSVVRWCARKGLHDELASIVREAPTAAARSAWQALRKRCAEEDWLIAALQCGRRFAAEWSALAAEVVAAAEKGETVGDAGNACRVLVEGVLPAVPHGEAIGLLAAQAARKLAEQGVADAIPIACDELAWRAQLAARLPAGAERDALLTQTFEAVERPQHACARWASVKKSATRRMAEGFDSLLLRTVLEMPGEPAERALVLQSLEAWPLRLPVHAESRRGDLSASSIAVLCAVPPKTVRPIWARTLRVYARVGRAKLVRDLALYAPVIGHTGGADMARRLAEELMALPRWWP